MDCITTGYAIDGGLGLATNKGWMLNCAPLPVSLVVEHQDQQNHKDKHLHNSACAKMATGVAESLRRHRCKLDNKRQAKSNRHSLKKKQTLRPYKAIDLVESFRRHRCKLDNKRQVKSPRYSLNNEQTSRPNKTIAGTHISQTKTCWTSDVPLTIPAPGIQRLLPKRRIQAAASQRHGR